MSLTRRGTAVLATLTVTTGVVGALGYFTLNPEQAPAIVRTTLRHVGLVEAPPPPPPDCPLTGEQPVGGLVPDRPVLAVKVENYPDARPQAGLQSADIVYEEPVEGGITRFVILYQCRDDTRVGPVRSARTADPEILAQYGVPILAYSGGAPNVVRVIEEADLVSLDEATGGEAFLRDEAREAPHNLYASTRRLYATAGSTASAPAPVFRFSETLDVSARPVAAINLPFSSNYADVWWRWDTGIDEWVRSHGDVPHVVETGGPVTADNIVVQVVEAIIGPNGGLTPHLELVGTGKAYVFRDGKMIAGTWERPTLDDITRFVAKDGTEIALAPGRTWVELLPSTIALEISR